MQDKEEEDLLRSAALKNANSILLARQRAEEALQKQSELLRITLASIGDAVISTDADGRVTFMNGVAETLTGWPQSEATGQLLADVFRIINEHTRQPAENPALRALREGTVMGLANHTLLIAKDGTERAIDDSAAPIRDREENVVGCVLIFRDITDRRKLEEAASERTRLIALRADVAFALAQGVSVPACLQQCTEALVKHLDLAFARIWTMNETEEVLELQASAGMYTHLDGPHGRIKVGDFKIGRIAKNRQPHLSNVVPDDPEISDPDWARREGIVAFAGYPLLIDGRVVGVLGMFARRPLTEGTLSEIAPLVGVIAQWLLRQQAEKALREADRHKNEFLAMLAHELRNPLAPIRNALQLVRLSCPTPLEEVGHAYDVIERQIETLVRLVDDLLDMSRITSGKIHLQKERVDLATVVSRAVEGARPLIDARRHILEVKLPEEVLTIEGDPVRLAQVLWNLLNNAAKYTPEGGRIWLTVAKEQSEAVVRVRDTGLGITTEMLPRVFDLFIQTERTLARAEGGLGIGLTLVRRLTQMHNGTVEAMSKGPGQGSEFVVRLPVADDIVAVSPSITSGAQEQTGPTSGNRILVVDDNRDSAESLAMLLRLFGNDVRTAYDGRLALEVAAAYRPDVVLLDIGLPGLDGLEVCRRLRKQTKEPQALIVAMTGYGQDEDRRRSEKAGFNAHMVKPVDLEALQELLSRPELMRRAPG